VVIVDMNQARRILRSDEFSRDQCNLTDADCRIRLQRSGSKYALVLEYELN